MSRYDLLVQLHAVLEPRGYLEVGVQSGGSLSLATCPAIGVDPNPLVQATGQQRIYAETSDAFFARTSHPGHPAIPFPLDMVFLDGSHLFEDTLKDFMNVERYANRNTVVVFDDVLPYNAGIGMRAQPPGDWCGDVWKIDTILRQHRPDLKSELVDSWPVGALVVWGLDPASEVLAERYDAILAEHLPDLPPYDDVLTRAWAITPDALIEKLRLR